MKLQTRLLSVIKSTADMQVLTNEIDNTSDWSIKRLIGAITTPHTDCQIAGLGVTANLIADSLLNIMACQRGIGVKGGSELGKAARAQYCVEH